jgi:hypothetical protein
MTKMPFSGFPERASDLLELIHTDVLDQWVRQLEVDTDTS